MALRHVPIGLRKIRIVRQKAHHPWIRASGGNQADYSVVGFGLREISLQLERRVNRESMSGTA